MISKLYIYTSIAVCVVLIANSTFAVPDNRLYSLNNPGTLPDSSFSRFGAAAALGKTILFIAAPDYDNGATDTGQVFAYDYKSSNFMSPAFGAIASAGDHLGSTLVANTKYLVAGAPGHTIPGSFSVTGAGNVVVRNLKTGTDFTLGMENPSTNAGYGTGLALSNDILAIGGPKAISQAGVPVAGTVNVFNIKTGPLSVGPLTDPNAATNDAFGTCIAMSKKFIAVGAPGRTVSGLGGAGAVVIFDLKTLAYLGTIENPHPEAGAGFGSSIALGTTVLAVGAPNADAETGLGHRTDLGRVYEYDVRSRAFLRELMPSTNTNEAHFGACMSTDGKTLVVGTPDDAGASVSEGATNSYVLKTGQYLRINISDTPVAAGGFGRAVTVLKGGNYVVGAPGEHDSSGNTVGRVHLFKKFTTLPH